MSHHFCQRASAITIWTERNSIRLESKYIPGKQNILAGQLSRPDQILPTEWSFLTRVFDRFCRVFGRPHLDLFATRASNKFPLYVSPVPDLLAWKQDALHLPSDPLKAYAFSLFALLCQVITRVMESEGLRLLLVAPLWALREWFEAILDLLIAEPLELPRVWNLLVQPHLWMCHRGLKTSGFTRGISPVTRQKGWLFAEG